MSTKPAAAQTNALNRSETWSYTGNIAFGGPTGHTGPNGLTTAWNYDTFGRRILEVRPDGNQTATSYVYCTTASCSTPPGLTLAQMPANVQFYVMVQPETSAGAANGPISVTYYDGLSRAITADVEGFDAAGTGCTATAPCWIRTATQYDANGRVAQTSRPYFVAGGTPKWTVNTFDTLGRATLVTLPDASTVATRFCGLTISTTNANGQIKTSVHNDQGLVAQVYEAASSTCGVSGAKTAYVYDAFSNLLTITDAALNTVANNTYDIRGRKTQSIDPDKGTWTYVYDGFGELRSQTDANARTTLLTYDALGRALTSNPGGTTSTFVYDTATGKGIGQLASASTSGSFSKALAYDSLGRPASLQITEDGTASSYLYGYDANGRLYTLTYPSGFEVEYLYTTAGYLSSIVKAADGTAVWTANTRDAELHLLTQTEGNGVGITQAFDPNTGLVSSILAGTGNSLSNQTFTFDPLGNLIRRTWLNGSAVVGENACYDGLNRLTGTHVTTGTSGQWDAFNWGTGSWKAACTGGSAISVSYDLIGNITEKTDVCSTANCFVYGGSGAGPHALTSIVGTYNGVTNPTFAYDANGMLTSGAGRTVTATHYDMVASITEGSNSATFSYDADHARYKMVTTGVSALTTYYLNDLTGAMEEETTTGGQPTWHDYIMADGKLVAERFCTGAAPCSTGRSYNYFILDHLGSVSVILDGSGALIAQLSYDAWGKRRNPDGSAINCTAGTAPPAGVTRGFTGHEMLDGLCLINMNARVQDPALGRFLSADPTVADPTVPQELNRYSYVLNNPLSLTDPSGLCFLGCFWNQAWFRDVIAVAVGVLILEPELPLLNALQILGQTTAFYEASFETAFVIGGVTGAIATGSLKGAALSALEAGLFSGAGDLLGTGGALSGGFAGVGHTPTVFIVHGLVGGLTTALGGGRFGAGFLAGGLGSLTPSPIGGQSWEETFEGATESAALGGAGSALGGGKFDNGAVTGAFGYLFNALIHAYHYNPEICDYGDEACSKANAWEGLKHVDYPGQDPNTEVQNGGRYFVFGNKLGGIVVTVDEATMTITNSTISTHIFCCGSVRLHIYDNLSGVFLDISGSGTNTSLFTLGANYIGSLIFPTWQVNRLDYQIDRSFFERTGGWPTGSNFAPPGPISIPSGPRF